MIKLECTSGPKISLKILQTSKCFPATQCPSWLEHQYLLPPFLDGYPVQLITRLHSYLPQPTQIMPTHDPGTLETQHESVNDANPYIVPSYLLLIFFSQS
jgi:hypothetical protein